MQDSGKAGPALLPVLKRIYPVLLFVLVVVAGWQSPNYIMPTAPLTDSGIFMSVAHHLRSGEVLYRDVWDHKPPMVYLLNLAAISVNEDGVNTIRQMEKVFGLFIAALFFLVVYGIVSNSWFAFFTSCYFLLVFYDPVIFEGGNLTEEYGTVFFLAMVLCSLPKYSGRFPSLSSFGSGLFAGFACLTKEPFLLLCIPWLVAGWMWKGNDWRSFWRTLLLQSAGVVVAIMPFALYFIWHSALLDWAKTIAYNFSYSAMTKKSNSGAWELLYYYSSERVFHQLHLFRIIGVIGIFSVLDRTYQRTMNYLPLIAGLSFLLSLVAVGLPKLYFGHYYLMLVPTWSLMVVLGLHYLKVRVIPFAFQPIQFANKTYRRAVVYLGGPIFVLALCLLIFNKDFKQIPEMAKRAIRHDYLFFLGMKRLSTAPVRYSSEIAANEVLPLDVIRKEGLWAQSGYCHYYLELGAISPSPFIYAPDHLFLETLLETKNERIATFRDKLETQPPGLLVMGKFQSILPEDDGFFKRNYIRINRPEIGSNVFVRNDLTRLLL